MTTAIDLAFARANLYRFLSLAFAYPTKDVHADLVAGGEAAIVAAGAISPRIQVLTREVARRLATEAREDIGASYRQTFTFSASPDCPMNESAYSAKHVYQEVQELADISGFYAAFGLEIAGERPDELAAELEFCALLSLKEAAARERKMTAAARVCREGLRLFMHDHLGRWAENIGRRIQVLAPETIYAGFGGLLAELAQSEIVTLKAGPIDYYQEVPNAPEALEDDNCPAEEGLGEPAFKLQGEDFLTQLREVASFAGGGT